MTDEERIEYCRTNEPTKIKHDDLGRFYKRIWRLASGKILEIYHYDHTAAEIIKANKAALKSKAPADEKQLAFEMRNCFIPKQIQINIQREDEVDDINE